MSTPPTVTLTSEVPVHVDRGYAGDVVHVSPGHNLRFEFTYRPEHAATDVAAARRALNDMLRELDEYDPTIVAARRALNDMLCELDEDDPNRSEEAQ